MTSYLAAGARGRDTALNTNTRYLLRPVVDIRFRAAANPGVFNSFELIGDCGHVVDVHRRSGLQESDLERHRERHRELYVGARRKRCRHCPAIPAQRN